LQQEEQSKINKFSYYFIKALEFYTLKKDILVKISFIINFICIFAFFKIPRGLVSWQVYGLYFLLFSVISLCSLAYLFAIIKELRGKEYSTGTSLKRLKKKAGTLILSSVAFGGVSLIGILLFILPGIYFASIYFLHNCYILDLGESFEDSYEASKRLTKPFRETLFKYFLIFALIVVATGYVFLSMMATSGSVLIVTFALSFFGSVVILIYQRFIAYIYFDIEYNETNNKA